MKRCCGFNLINTKNNMCIHLNWNHNYNDVYGTVEINNDYGSNVFNIRDVTKFEECNKDLISKFKTKEKYGHCMDVDILKFIYEIIKSNKKYEHLDDDETWSASSHQEVISKMSNYIRVIRFAFSQLYYSDERKHEYKSFYNTLRCKPLDLEKFVFMTEKGYALEEKKGEKSEVYGTVDMFTNYFCINPVNFEKGISYDGICKCIRNINICISKIIEAYVVLNVPPYYIVSYVTPHNGVNFFENGFSASMKMSNMISSIVQLPIQIIPESCFFGSKHCVSWADIDRILDSYGF